ncbi:hypothetical protein [Candidatus Cyanaurora vandensis]|nr:hypothetical protein [Candidatus Cyanaurora vandensis]
MARYGVIARERRVRRTREVWVALALALEFGGVCGLIAWDLMTWGM